ncbi:acyltransferase family protein [Bosea sp. PAMC 26642]|uniref:acyltransferase family protein n=1 Tax=Bosea sp. (strain PAMC 26642) TaxID=1792307 RepID=UPI0007706596|nr:acyltransferase [Bosea sp. PAMC 26642]AMJ60170.1 hypothetical protein AXW83_07540 [Bosea sp. PAMC 26642]
MEKLPVLTGLQALRIQAATLVLWSHLITELAKAGVISTQHNLLALQMGGFGVKIFFAVSGFIMVRSSRSGFGKKGFAVDFMIRRLYRIAPLYYLTASIWMATVFFLGHHEMDIVNVIKTFLFLPYLDHRGSLEPYYNIGWTLNYEMYFYAVFALALCFRYAIGVCVCIGLIALVFAAGQLYAVSAGDSGARLALFVYSRGIVFYFVLGMIIAVSNRFLAPKLKVIGHGAGLALSTVLIVVALTFDSKAIAFAICFCLIMAANLEAPPHRGTSSRDDLYSRWVVFLGNASYSVYLTHVFVLVPVVAVLARFGSLGVAGFTIAMVVATALCLAIGAIVHVTVERPLHLALNGRRLRPAVAA